MVPDLPQVSYLEIYNEQMYDLLAENPGASESLAVMEDAVTGTYVSALAGCAVRTQWMLLGLPRTPGLTHALECQVSDTSHIRLPGARNVVCMHGLWCGDVLDVRPSRHRNVCGVRHVRHARPSTHNSGIVCVQVRGLTRVDVGSEEEALAQYFVGEQGRSTARHVLNAHSSRSHCVFTLHLEVCDI